MTTNNKNAGALAALFLPLLCWEPASGDTRRQSDLTSVSPVETVSGEELEAAGLRSVEDVLNMVPATPGTRGTSPATGGTNINLRGLGAGRGQVMVDGRTVPGPIYPNAIPLLGLDRVEVIKGPQGVIPGSDSGRGATNYDFKDEEQLSPPGASAMLGSIHDALKGMEYALESDTECDASNGEFLPYWALLEEQVYGLPYFHRYGAFFGSPDKGFQPPTAPIAPPRIIEEQKSGGNSWGLEPGFGFEDDPLTPRLRYEVTDADGAAVDGNTPPELRGQTFHWLNAMFERIRNDPRGTPTQKGDFFGGWGLGMALSGPQHWSDQAVARGLVDPEWLYQEYRRFIDQPVVGVPEAAKPQVVRDSEAAAAEMTAPPDPPPTATPAKAEDALAPSQPAGSTAQMPVPEDPFEKFDITYPPDYAFDFKLCSPEDAERMRKLIRDRDQTVADWFYYMDYMRDDEVSSEQRAEDFRLAAEAKARGNRLNEELRSIWYRCIGKPLPGTDTRVADSGTTTPAESEAIEKIDIELEIRRQNVVGGLRTPVPDIGIRWRYRDWDAGLKLPLDPGAFRDIEFDADKGGDRQFTDSEGKARFTIDQHFAVPSEWKSPGSGRMDFSDSLPRTRDYGIGLRYDLDTSRPTISLRLNFSKIDSFLIEKPGLADMISPFSSGLPPRYEDENPWPEIVEEAANPPRSSSNGAGAMSPAINGTTNDEADSYSADFVVPGYAGSLTLGRSRYYEFYFDEAQGYDLGRLKDKGYIVSENTCGETAVPPEGLGYVPSALAAVQSVADHWAPEAVGVTPEMAFAGRREVVVGIIDTGLDWHHADLDWSRLWHNEGEIPANGIDDDGNGYVDDQIGWNFMNDDNYPWDNDGHGTFVAGLIAATPGNDIGIDGINPNVRIMVLKALNNFGRTRASHVAEAIKYGVDNGAQILNLSITGSGFPRIVQHAIDYAEERGVLVIMAAGNRAEDIDAMQPRPLEGVLHVGATDSAGERAAFSNIGDRLNLVAPGVDIVSLRARRTDFLHSSRETSYVPDDAIIGEDRRYYRASGTSFAAPVVAGVASLVWSARPELTHAQLKRVLEQSATDIGTPGRDRLTGYGLVNARAALNADPDYYVDAKITAVRKIEDRGREYLQVVGRGDADRMRGAWLEVGDGEDPASWQRLAETPLQPGEETELARIPAIDLIGKPSVTLRLVVEHADGSQREARQQVTLSGG